MLYLHCGWPRTGTSSLQSAIYRRRTEFRAAGTLFPSRWLSHLSPTHHGLSESLEASRTSTGAVESLTAFLDEHRDFDVLFSAESITTWVIDEEKHETLLAFLASLREATAIRCVWTLRRIDEVIRALYLQMVPKGRAEIPSAVAQYRYTAFLSPLFTGMRRVEELLDGSVVYIKYASSGAHQRELLQAFGIEEETASRLGRDLDEHRRLNGSFSHKQAALLANAAELSVRAGVELDPASLARAARRGELVFPDDSRCEPVDGATSRRLHEQALAAAREAGFSPYVEFFGNDEIPASTATPLAPEVLADDDLERAVMQQRGLVTALEGVN